MASVSGWMGWLRPGRLGRVALWLAGVGVGHPPSPSRLECLAPGWTPFGWFGTNRSNGCPFESIRKLTRRVVLLIAINHRLLIIQTLVSL